MSETRDSLGDRMKRNYEDRQRCFLTRRMPVIVRVDGKAFHTLTRGMDRPFDHLLIDVMRRAAMAVSEQMQGFKLAYVQSDEASFLMTDYDTLTTEAWFDYNKSKVETIAASTMSATFSTLLGKLGIFDGRAFNVPREEVTNYFLWRTKDWARNSVSMYARTVASAKQMHGQGKADQHEMLHAAGKNWATDLSETVKNGTFIRRGEFITSVLPSYPDVAALVEPLIADNKQV